MPTLTLKFKEKNIKAYKLGKGQSLSIGRRDGNDVVIENLAVSGNHAKIDAVGDGFLLTDLQSKNGTFVNEKQITQHYLKDGDEIIIGKHTLSFGYDPGESKPDDGGVGVMDKTIIMDTTRQRELLSKTVSDMAENSSPRHISGVLSFLSGGEGDVELKKKLIKIGKDPSSDIVIPGLMVGKTAATISKRPQGYHFSYVAGMAKPKINDKPVKESVELNEFDVIEIGSVKMQFIYK